MANRKRTATDYLRQSVRIAGFFRWRFNQYKADEKREVRFSRITVLLKTFNKTVRRECARMLREAELLGAQIAKEDDGRYRIVHCVGDNTAYYLDLPTELAQELVQNSLVIEWTDCKATIPYRNAGAANAEAEAAAWRKRIAERRQKGNDAVEFHYHKYFTPPENPPKGRQTIKEGKPKKKRSSPESTVPRCSVVGVEAAIDHAGLAGKKPSRNCLCRSCGRGAIDAPFKRYCAHCGHVIPE